MKVLWSWLLELVDLDRMPTAEEGAKALTGAGLEVEAFVELGATFRGVVVAEVVGKRPHPNAEKLTLVDVITERGGAATQVVCGAPNVPAPGRKVLWARPGAELPGGMKLAVKAVKGIESPGMLCSETELQIGDDDDGIIVLEESDATPLGDPAQKALYVDDWMLEINAPANRGDALGHLGIARELAALLGGRLVPPAARLDDLIDDSLDAAKMVAIDIKDPEGCPRYVARVIDGLVTKPSPRRIRQRLRGVGVRPISNLVDATNYVMFELGQPLHAFDYANVAGAKIEVRRAKAGEKLVTLDNVERTLEAHDLLICDGNGPTALAGVMGGLHSEIVDTTTRVLLESASFHATTVRRTARRLALHSEASLRFGRGVDPETSELASRRAAELLARLGGGKIARGSVDAHPRPRTPSKIGVRWDRLRAVTGVDLAPDDAARALARLGFEIDRSDRGANVTPPSARADVAREIDVIEEVIRVVGFDRVPTTLPKLSAAPKPLVDPRPDRARRALAAAGLAEAITFGFQSPARVAALRLPDHDRRAHPVALRNPMSIDQAVMRTSLLPNLLGAIARNRSFGVHDVALFEVGSVFLRKQGQATTGEITELADGPIHACVVLAGARPTWLGAPQPWDFFDAKGMLEALLVGLVGAEATRAIELEPARDIPYLHPGLAARVRVGDQIWGEIGEVHPETREALGVDVPVFMLDVDVLALPPPALAQMRPIPKYPSATRDVSLLLSDTTPAARIRSLVTGPLVESVRLIEDYRDAKLPAGQKSMLWSITYRAPDRTLTDSEVESAHEALVARLMTELGATRR
ncbi:MAG TPA: phenylalanine--tRNA ligase subunit beta [Kofleriaceae bacterium]|nr:phenylalanine--tRNA ligase subunit beta [Kofleriaceae bacterium]